MSREALPKHLPIIVFAGAHNETRAQWLGEAPVDAVMVSFEYIRTKAQQKAFFEKTFPYYSDKGIRMYLDSGLFTLMKRVKRAKKVSACSACEGQDETHSLDCVRVAAYKALAKDYCTYLETYGDIWDHAVELDADRILGSRYTQVTREILTGVVGDKLLPVWHIAAGMSAWEDMISKYPYVCIGAGGWGAGTFDSPRKFLYRSLVDTAHAKGVLVHGLGSTKISSFRDVGWDTADSTTWISVNRFGKVGGNYYSEVGIPQWAASMQGKVRPARIIDEYLESKNIDPTKVSSTGGQTREKILASVWFLLDRQEDLRRGRKFV